MLLRLLWLLVQVIKARKLPAGPRLLEMIDYDLVSGGVRTGDTETFRVFRIDLDLRLAETGSGVGLFVEDLSISFAKLGLGPDRRDAVRHREWKLGQMRDRLNVVLADGRFKTLKESLSGVGAAEQQE